MTYEEAIAAAPQGWSMFEVADIERLPAAIGRRVLRDVPASDLASARAGHTQAAERVRRALFWTFIYQLRPDLWSALAAAEPVHPRALRLLHELGADRGHVLEIGAGSGRLTVHLLGAGQLVALDPSLPLLRVLRSRGPRAFAVAAWADALPVRDRWADATVACASVGPDRGFVSEARRVTRSGGVIVLISPEPGDWEGWSVERFDPEEVGLPHRDVALDRIFGKPKPPSEVVWAHRP